MNQLAMKTLKCSSSSLSHELNLEMRHVSKNIHDEEESNEIIEHPFHPLSSLVLYGGNSSNQCDHEIFLIHISSDLRSKEYYDLIDLFVEVEKYGQTSDVNCCHLNDGDLVHSSFSRAICNLTQFTKCCYLYFQSSGNFQEVEALQHSLMVMSGSCDPSEIPKPCQIWIFSQNSFFRIISLDGNSFLMDFEISHYNFVISQDWVSDHTIVVNSSSYKYLVSNSGLQCIPFSNVWNHKVDQF